MAAPIILYITMRFTWEPFRDILQTINPSPNLRSLNIIDGVYIDYVGGIIPLITSFIALIYVIWRKYLSSYWYLLGLFVSIIINRSISVVDGEAITTQFLILDIFVASMTVIIMMFREYLRKGLILELSFKHIFIVGYSYASFSVILTDLMYIPFLDYEKIIIGGAGLIDGIFLAGLFFLPVLIIVWIFF
jgi:hypothetical protein